MTKTKFSLLLLGNFLFFNAMSQNLSEIKVDGWLCCNLHDVLKDLSEEHTITFAYDTVLFSKIKFNQQLYHKPLDLFLTQICAKNKMKYYRDKHSTIHIVDRWFDQEAELLATKNSYSGPPVKKDFTLQGKVVDKNSKESLPFVSMIVQGTSLGTVSNVDGYFSLINIPSDTVTLKFSYIGYQERLIYLNPETNVANLNVELVPATFDLNEVVVTGDFQDILQVSGNQVGMIKMSPLKLVTLPNLGEKDILRSLQLMPGISAANENSSGLYVRGGTPDQVLVLYDGFTVYNVEHLFGFFSAFNSNAIKDVQLYKGGFDAKYGGRLAGVAEITGKEGDQKKFNLSGDLSLMSMNAFAEMPIGDKASGLIAIRRSWSSPIYDKIFDQFVSENETTSFGRGGASSTQETASYFYDLNARFTFRPSDKDVLSLSIYNGEDNLDNSITPPSMSRYSGVSLDIETKDLTNWGNTGTSFKWSRRFSPQFYMNTLISYSNYFSVRDRSTTGTFVGRSGSRGAISRPVHEDNNLNDYSFKSDFEYKWNKNQQIEFGVQLTYNDIDYTYSQNDTLTIIDRSSSGTVYSAYLQDKLNLFDGKLSLTPGLRYNYFTETERNYYEPRINGIVQVTDKLKLKASAGKYYQFAKRVIREDITEGSRDFWVLSDDNKLPVSSSIQYVVGASFETKNYLFDVEAYYKELSNITEYSLRINTDRSGINYDENFFTGSGISKGIDFLIQKKFGKYTGWIGYTLGEVTNNIPAYGDYDFYAANDVTNEIKIVQSYQWKNWIFGVTWIYATGRPYTAPEGGYQLTLLDGTLADFINVSVKNGNRLPDYHRLDLSATYNFKFGTSPATLSFSLFNAYNRANVWYKEYEIIDNEVIETPVYYLGLTPNINLTFKLK